MLRKKVDELSEKVSVKVEDGEAEVEQVYSKSLDFIVKDFDSLVVTNFKIEGKLI